ncbi:ThiF family adenylyltransferase [Acinetobacter sp. YH12058]|uniref:ThiF family adenylyltransferase n=1 Tax=Acinetobacter sp. YH12058 TaxID=2601058 RepID=UPI0015D136D5|nr:ThiF family adenylyltransferase [Acinetobacter sp. YH12058]
MFFDEEKLEKIKQVLNGYGANNIHLISTSKNTVSLKFDISLDKTQVCLGLAFQNNFLWTSPPSFTILTRPLPALDHVGHNGLICTTDHQGENFNGNNHEELIAFFLKKTIEILDQSFSNLASNNRISLYNELEGYLNNISSVTSNVILHCDPVSTTEMYGWIRKTGKQNPSVEHIDDGKNAYINRAHLTKVQIKRVLLDDSSIFPIPKIDTDFTENDFLKVIESLPSYINKDLLKTGNHNVLIGIPNEHGFAYLLFTYSIWYKFNKQILFQNFKISLTQRAWQAYLLNRTGQEKIERHVAILGCGALGSKIAEILAQTGISKFSFIDPDKLTTDNIYRHSLGLPKVNNAKSIALAEKLKLERPGLAIFPFCNNAEEWIKTSNIEDVDTIIIAIGHTPTEISLVRYIYGLNKNFHVIVAWVEPYNLGGHFISFNNKQLGCLNCLYFDEKSNKSLLPKYKYVTSGQLLAKNITGCAGAFTPFSSLNCVKLASYVGEYTLSNLTGFVSLSGDDINSKKNGVSTTQFYNDVSISNGFKILSLSEIYEEVCPCCNT